MKKFVLDKSNNMNIWENRNGSTANERNSNKRRRLRMGKKALMFGILFSAFVMHFAYYIEETCTNRLKSEHSNKRWNYIIKMDWREQNAKKVMKLEMLKYCCMSCMWFIFHRQLVTECIVKICMYIQGMNKTIPFSIPSRH